MKIVINRCYGGFGLSPKAYNMYCAEKNISAEDFVSHNIPRNDPVLISIVETLGLDADGKHSELKVVDIPDNVDWVIQEYDGMEYVAERHRIWS